MIASFLFIIFCINYQNTIILKSEGPLKWKRSVFWDQIEKNKKFYASISTPEYVEWYGVNFIVPSFASNSPHM